MARISIKGLNKGEAKELRRLEKLAEGTDIKIKRIGPANVIISSPGLDDFVTQLNSNVGISATTVLKARREVYFRDRA